VEEERIGEWPFLLRPSKLGMGVETALLFAKNGIAKHFGRKPAKSQAVFD